MCTVLGVPRKPDRFLEGTPHPGSRHIPLDGCGPRRVRAGRAQFCGQKRWVSGAEDHPVLTAHWPGRRGQGRSKGHLPAPTQGPPRISRSGKGDTRPSHGAWTLCLIDFTTKALPRDGISGAETGLGSAQRPAHGGLWGGKPGEGPLGSAKHEGRGSGAPAVVPRALPPSLAEDPTQVQTIHPLLCRPGRMAVTPWRGVGVGTPGESSRPPTQPAGVAVRGREQTCWRGDGRSRAIWQK